jgi:hypothetical protein
MMAIMTMMVVLLLRVGRGGRWRRRCGGCRASFPLSERCTPTPTQKVTVAGWLRTPRGHTCHPPRGARACVRTLHQPVAAHSAGSLLCHAAPLCGACLCGMAGHRFFAALHKLKRVWRWSAETEGVGMEDGSFEPVAVYEYFSLPSLEDWLTLYALLPPSLRCFSEQARASWLVSAPSCLGGPIGVGAGGGGGGGGEGGGRFIRARHAPAAVHGVEIDGASTCNGWPLQVKPFADIECETPEPEPAIIEVVLPLLCEFHERTLGFPVPRGALAVSTRALETARCPTSVRTWRSQGRWAELMSGVVDWDLDSGR